MDIDCLDALSDAVNYWVEQMDADANKKIVERNKQKIRGVRCEAKINAEKN